MNGKIKDVIDTTTCNNLYDLNIIREFIKC